MEFPCQLTYDFLRLYYQDQRSIILDLGLVTPDDLIMCDTNLFEKAFDKACEDKKVNELRKAVTAKLKG